MGFLPGPVPYLSSPLYPGLQDPWVGGTEAGYNQGQQGGQTDRQHTASAPPRGSMHSQQSRSQHRQRTQASGPTDTPPPPAKPHQQQLEQCRRVPVPRGVEQQHTHLGAAAGRKGGGGPCPMGTPGPPPCPAMCVISPPIPSLLMGLVLVEGSLAEPADASLDAAGGVSPVQVPRHGAAGQHLGPAQPLRVPQAWERGGGAQGMAGTPRCPSSTGTPAGIKCGVGSQAVPSSTGSTGQGPGVVSPRRALQHDSRGSGGQPGTAIPHLGSWHRWVERWAPAAPASPPARCLMAPPSVPRDLGGQAPC